MPVERQKRIKQKAKILKNKMVLSEIYWKSDKFWLGKLLEHPEIMTQGETFE
jgi:hypothetical protein